MTLNRPWRVDHEYLHTRSTEALPLFGVAINSGLARVEANGWHFRARMYGLDNQGPALVMLHGFPGSSIMWDGAARKAQKQGYRVLAYDQRGYSPGARPIGKTRYEIHQYTADLQAIADAVGFETFHLVGHDIGAVVAWGAAMGSPERIRSLNVLSIPNPEILTIRPYVKLLTIPRLPEALLTLGGFKLLRRILPEGRSKEANDEYERIFTEPGALTSALNFYRGVNKSVEYLQSTLSARIQVPTRFTYGHGEGWVNPAHLAAQRDRMAPEVELDVAQIQDAGKSGHFLIENQPDAVIDGILSHIERHPSAHRSCSRRVASLPRRGYGHDDD